MEMLDFSANVGLALLLGSVIGLERQLRQHPAGLRTNALVSVGAALFVSLSSLLDDKNSPTRIAAYVVSGIGFLGGGVILKEGINVRGMNTAATLWCTAAVGTLVGSGFRWHAVVGVVGVMLALVALRPLTRWVDARQKRLVVGEQLYQIRVTCEDKQDRTIRAVVMRHIGSEPGMMVIGIASRRRKGRKRILAVDISADPANDRAVQDTVNRLTIEPGVRATSWHKLSRPGE